MLNGIAGRLLLGRCLEEELVDPAHGQALGEVIKGTVFIAAVVAMAVGFATTGETLDQRGAQAVGADLDLGKEESLAVAQGKSRLSGVVYPSHV